VHFCILPYYIFTLLLLPYIIILFLHLRSTNHKCTQPCYFPLLYKPVAQKVNMDWNSSMRSSWLALSRLHSCGLWSPPLFGSVRVILILRDIIFVIIIPYSWHLAICKHFLSVCVEQMILGRHAMSTWWHTSDEYLVAHMRWVLGFIRKIRYDTTVLSTKLGITRSPNPDRLSGLVFTTHMHDGFECPSPS
jgi:hypothetical protein